MPDWLKRSSSNFTENRNMLLLWLAWLSGSNHIQIENRRVKLKKTQKPCQADLASLTLPRLPKAIVDRFGGDECAWQVVQSELAMPANGPATDGKQYCKKVENRLQETFYSCCIILACHLACEHLLKKILVFRVACRIFKLIVSAL